MNNNNDILSQLQAQQNAMQQQSSDIINNPVTTTPQAQPAGDVSAQDIGKALPAQGSTSTVAPVSQQQTPNWLEKLLPTAGGVLGSIGGALIPGLGEIGVGEAAGGAAGSAAGQALEDLLTGKQVGGDVGQAAIEGGIGGVGGKLLGAGISGAGKALSSNAERAIQGANQIAQDAATINKAKNVTALFGKNAANGIDVNFNNANDFASTLGHDISSNPAAAKSDIDKMISTLGSARDEALQKSGNIPLAGTVDESGAQITPSVQSILMDSFNKTTPNGSTISLADQLGGLGTKAEVQPTTNYSSRFVSSLSPVGGKTQATDLLTQVKTALSPLFKSGGTDVLTNAPATTVQDALTSLNNLRSTAYNALQKAGTDASTAENVPALQAKLDYINNVKSGIENMLYNRPEFSSALGDVTSKEGGLLDSLNSMGQSGQALASNLGNINPATGGKDFNRVFSNLLNAQDVVNPAAAKFSSPTSDFARLQATPASTSVDNNGNPIVNALINNNNPHVSLAGRALNFVSGKGGGVSSEGAQKVGDTLQKFAPILGTAGAQLAATSPGMTGEAGANTAVGQGLIIPQQQNPGSVESLIQNINPAAKALGLDLLYAQHRMPGQETTGLTSADLQEANSINRVQSARSQLVNLINLLNQSGGAQGQVGGNLAKLGGFFTGGPAAQYDTQAKQLTDSINSILGTNIQAPSITMNQEAANSVLNQLQQALISSGA